MQKLIGDQAKKIGIEEMRRRRRGPSYERTNDDSKEGHIQFISPLL
jgi:hypothetical protein